MVLLNLKTPYYHEKKVTKFTSMVTEATKMNTNITNESKTTKMDIKITKVVTKVTTIKLPKILAKVTRKQHHSVEATKNQH